MLEASVNGRFELFGREHEAMAGVSYGSGEHNQEFRPTDPGDPSWGALPAFPYAGNAFDEPTWGPVETDSFTDQSLKRGFGATRLSVTDRDLPALGSRPS